MTGSLHTKGPVFDVRAFDAVGDGIADDTAACQAAIDYAASFGTGGTVYFPPGFYYVPGGLVVPCDYVNVRGEGGFTSVLRANSADVTVLTLQGGRCVLSEIGIWGKGVNHDTGAFGSTKPALKLEEDSSNCVLRNVHVMGGSLNMVMLGGDNYVDGCQFYGSCYGMASVFVGAGNWFVRTKFDCNWPAQYGPTPTIQKRANGANYQVGNLVSLSGYVLQCMTAGKAAAGAPALKNYGVDIVDGTATWQLAKPMNNLGVQIEGTEVSFVQCDFTGTYSHCVALTNSLGSARGPQYVYFDQCVASQGTDSGIAVLSKAGALYINNSRIGAGFLATGIGVYVCESWLSTLNISNSLIGGTGTRALYGVYVGGGSNITIAGNEIVGAGVGIRINDGVSHFTITNNHLGSGTVPGINGANVCPVQIGAKCDYYVISGNIFHGATSTMVDGGAGKNKIVDRNL